VRESSLHLGHLTQPSDRTGFGSPGFPPLITSRFRGHSSDSCVWTTFNICAYQAATVGWSQLVLDQVDIVMVFCLKASMLSGLEGENWLEAQGHFATNAWVF
jgi:hypothetical protein